MINLSAAMVDKIEKKTFNYQYGEGQLALITLHLHELASHSPFGLNLTAETAFVCPANVNFNV